MQFNNHYNLQGKHAFLSASNYHWVNYTPEKLAEVYLNKEAIERGTRLHAFAAEAVQLGRKQPRTKDTINMYINDCINHHMTVEQVLYYSDYCFGTADAITFINNKLKIFDLKTGKTPANLIQLKIYAALFCLEYNHNPLKLESIEIRIYQNNEVIAEMVNNEEIRQLMNKIVDCSKILSDMQYRI